MLEIYDVDVKQTNGEYNIRKLNKIIFTIMKINDKKIRNKLLIEKLFLNYELFCTVMNLRLLNLTNYCLSFDFIKELLDLFNNTDENIDDDCISAISVLIQSICISINESLTKYPQSIGTQICSRINCLYGLNDYFTKFIDDCDRLSLNECSLIAPCQLMPLNNSRLRLVHNFYKKIIDFQDLGLSSNNMHIEFFLYGNTVGLFNWNKISSKTSELIKEIDLPQGLGKFKLLRVFKYIDKDRYGMVVASDFAIVCIDDNGQEISKPKSNDSKISDVVLVETRGFIVLYEKKNYLNIFETHSSDHEPLPIHKEKFNSIITHFSYNKSETLGWTDGPLFISIFLQNSELRIYQVICSSKTEKMRASINLNLVYKYAFQNTQLVSGAFELNQNLIQDSSKFSFVSVFENKRFLLIEMDEKSEIKTNEIFIKIEENFSIFKIIAHYCGILVYQDYRSTFFFHKKTKKLVSIPAIYKEIDIFGDLDSFLRIYANNQEYLDIYLIKFYGDNYEIVNLISKFQFMDQIQSISINSEYFKFLLFLFHHLIVFCIQDNGLTYVRLKNGCLFDISTNSFILSQIQNQCFSRTTDRIDYILSMGLDNRCLTFSTNTQ